MSLSWYIKNLKHFKMPDLILYRDSSSMSTSLDPKSSVTISLNFS